MTLCRDTELRVIASPSLKLLGTFINMGGKKAQGPLLEKTLIHYCHSNIEDMSYCFVVSKGTLYQVSLYASMYMMLVAMVTLTRTMHNANTIQKL